MSDPIIDISDRRLGLGGPGAGFLMILWGYFADDPVIGFLGIVCIGGSGFILLRGTHARRKARQTTLLEETWASRQDELIERLKSGRNPDQIAAELKACYGLPTDLLYLLEWTGDAPQCSRAQLRSRGAQP